MDALVESRWSLAMYPVELVFEDDRRVSQGMDGSKMKAVGKVVLLVDTRETTATFHADALAQYGNKVSTY